MRRVCGFIIVFALLSWSRARFEDVLTLSDNHNFVHCSFARYARAMREPVDDLEISLTTVNLTTARTLPKLHGFIRELILHGMSCAEYARACSFDMF